jgi:formate hydrogenlyase subunit 6/NADH:ubiquinone oxidoreductase subunit I
MEIEAVRDELERGEVTTFDCVLCLRCIEACPRDACLGVTYEGRELASSRFRKEP